MPYSPTPIINSGNSPDMGLLERHHSRLKCQQERLMFFDESVVMDGVFSDSNGDRGLGELLMGAAVKLDPGMEMGVCALPRTVSFPPSKAARGISAVEEPLLSYAASAVERGSSKKRKADKNQNLKITSTEKSSEGKKKKVCKITEQNSSSKSTTTTVTNNKNSTGPSPNAKESSNSKGSENPKPDYIHVRARRGQATDSHSLAERVRREKISERMKFLQDLVPGCNTITGKAGMLDEIINYVQSLQRQVEFLSMKLAAVDTRLDFDADSYLVNETFCPMYRPCTPGLPEVGTSSNVLGPAMVQFENFGPNSGLEMVANPMDQALLDSPSSLNIQQLTWGDELQNLYTMDYQQGRFTSPAQPFTGVVLGAGHVKMEM